MTNEVILKAGPGLTPGGLEPKDRVGYKLDELKIRVDSYQKYINTTLQVNAFYYAITGAVLGFYLGKANAQLAYFLWLPILMGAVLGSIFLYAARLQGRAAECVRRIADDLNTNVQLGLEEIPDMYLLRPLLFVFGVIFFVVGLGLTVVPNLGASPSFRDFIYFPDDLLVFARGAYGILFLSGILLPVQHAGLLKKWWAGVRRRLTGKKSSTESESNKGEDAPAAP